MKRVSAVDVVKACPNSSFTLTCDLPCTWGEVRIVPSEGNHIVRHFAAATGLLSCGPTVLLRLPLAMQVAGVASSLCQVTSAHLRSVFREFALLANYHKELLAV